MTEGRYVDFHLHTNHSDGSDDPARVVERAAEAGLAAMAITDHDTVSGTEEAAEAAERLGLEFLTGTEISTLFKGRETHILGLGVDARDSRLLEGLASQAEKRNDRAKKIVAKLNELGVPVEYEKIAARVAGGVIGRMHIALEIVAAGHANSVQGAFDKFIKSGRPAFVPKAQMSPDEAVEVIHGAGGLAFVAHPGLGQTSGCLDALLALGFDGIEAYHSRHSPGKIEAFLEIANARGLLVTGGSDCHGTVKGESPLMGKVQVPYACFERIKEALNRRAFAP